MVRCVFALAVAVCLTVPVLAPLGCAPQAERVVRPAEDEADYDWYNYDLAKKPWQRPDGTAKDEPAGLSGSYTADQKHMLYGRKPRVSTKKHERDLISDMIWAREKHRNK